MTDSTDTRPEKKRRRFRLPLPLVILVGGFVAAFGLIASRPKPERVVTPRTPPTVTTQTLVSRAEPILVEGTGTVRPTSEIQLSAEVSGRVVGLSPQLVRGGSFQAGDTLLVIDRQSYLNAVAVARAEVEQREVEVALTEQEQIVAREEYRLLRQRVGGEFSDTSVAAQLALQQPQLEAARAALHRAEAQLADAMLDLERTVVRAPFSGRVRSESVDIGQYIGSGQAFADIYATDAVEVDISLSTREALLIGDLWSENSDQRIAATVRSDFGSSTFEWAGYVEHASGALDPTTRTVQIVVRIPDPFDTSDGRPPLLVGSYARATIVGRRPEAYFAIPRPALRDDGRALWLVGADDRLRAEPIEVIQEIEDTVFFRGSFQEGARVVVSDLAVMTEGMEVTLAGSESSIAVASDAPRPEEVESGASGEGSADAPSLDEVPSVAAGGGA
jgi:RND family efflux transporter MFP subunit